MVVSTRHLRGPSYLSLVCNICAALARILNFVTADVGLRWPWRLTKRARGVDEHVDRVSRDVDVWVIDLERRRYSIQEMIAR